MDRDTQDALIAGGWLGVFFGLIAGGATASLSTGIYVFCASFAVFGIGRAIQDRKRPPEKIPRTLTIQEDTMQILDRQVRRDIARIESERNRSDT
jgi:hypothetical protein